MSYGINYKIKHSQNFFYKMTNEEDGINYKIVKIPLPSKYLMLDELTERSDLKPKDKSALEVIRKEKIKLPGDRIVALPNSHYFEHRSNALEVKGKNQIQLIQPEELIKTDYDAKLLDFDITKNYLCVLEERNLVERLRTLTLKNNRWHTETLPEDYYHIDLEDNMTYNTQYIRYRLTTPHHPDKINQHNMGIHSTSTLSMDHYRNFDPSDYRTEKIEIKDCPIILSYNVKTYNDQSPFVLHTLGADSSKADFKFDPTKLSLMDRGIVYAYPMVRGTKYFDDDWYLSGLNLRRIERKLINNYV
jgi:protease II